MPADDALTPAQELFASALADAIVEDLREELERPLDDIATSLVRLSSWPMKVVVAHRNAA